MTEPVLHIGIQQFFTREYCCTPIGVPQYSHGEDYSTPKGGTVVKPMNSTRKAYNRPVSISWLKELFQVVIEELGYLA